MRNIALHVLRLNAHDAIPKPLDGALPRLIVLALHHVNRAVDLDDEPMRRAAKVDDEAPAERMLPAKVSAELPPAKLTPEKRFTARRRRAILTSKPNEGEKSEGAAS